MNKKLSSVLSFLGISAVVFLLPIFVATSDLAYAGVASDLNHFFDTLGFASNVSGPSAYQGQNAGYYTGGSIFARTAVRDIQIAQVELPSYRSGCGGIDIFSGGFSFINTDQLITVFKSVLNNAKSYAFTLAMETATPQLSNVMKYLSKTAQEINSLNINSCETAAGLVGSLWPRTQEAQRRVCEDIGTRGGIFTDYASAKQRCSTGGELTQILNRAQGAHKNMAFSQGNIAWKAIGQNGFLSSDHELAELFMSLSGSIIVRQNNNGGDGGPDNATNTFISLPSLVTSKSLLKALLNGGKTKIYKCAETEQCLYPSITDITIDEKKSLKYRVRLLLHSMSEKVITDTAITETDIGLLQASSLPLQKMLNVQAAFYRDQAVIDISNYSDIIAIDILFQYLSENLNIVRASTINLQYPEEIMSKFIAGIDGARKAIRTERKSAYEEITTTNHLIQQTQMIENMLTGAFSTRMNQTIEWARGGR